LGRQKAKGRREEGRGKNSKLKTQNFISVFLAALGVLQARSLLPQDTLASRYHSQYR
jgi:hypothetical protein